MSNLVQKFGLKDGKALCPECHSEMFVRQWWIITITDKTGKRHRILEVELACVHTPKECCGYKTHLFNEAPQPEAKQEVVTG